MPATATDATLTAKRGLIRDAFDNTDIVVLVDKNFDGRIMIGGGNGDATALPTVAAADGTTRLPVAATDFQTGTAATAGVRAGVIFYCAPPGATTSADFIYSWK